MRLGTVITFPILAPFRNITAHVEQSQFVGLFLGNWLLAVVAFGPIRCNPVTLVPRHFINLVTASKDEALALVSATCCKFPFGFGRQTEGFASHLVQLSEKRLAVLPCNHLYRTSHLRVIREITGIIAHDGLPQRLRNFGFADAKVRERHLMGWFLIITGFAALLWCRAHGESATFD